MVVVCVVCVLVVFGVFSVFGGNCATVNLEDVEGIGVDAEEIAEKAAAEGGAGTDQAIGVVEHAGMGTQVVDEKPTPDFADVSFCAVTTPLPPTPPESTGNNDPSAIDGTSFA